MLYRVFLTHKAEADVASILKWFADQRATDAGGRWFAQLLVKLETLEQHPERCPLADESEAIGEPIRQLLLGRGRYKYRLLFRITGKTVQLLRVRHGSRDAITREQI